MEGRDLIEDDYPFRTIKRKQGLGKTKIGSLGFAIWLIEAIYHAKAEAHVIKVSYLTVAVGAFVLTNEPNHYVNEFYAHFLFMNGNNILSSTIGYSKQTTH